LLGAKLEEGVGESQLKSYRRVFDFVDADGDGKHSRKEFVENGKYLTRKARDGIFRAADSNYDGFVSREEYVFNRIVTDEAKAIVQGMDTNGDGTVKRKEFLENVSIDDDAFASRVFDALDTDSNGRLAIPEYLRVWGRWARARTESVERPNIVVLYSDDAGYADFGFQPDCRDDFKKLTPRIDSLARDGVRFTNGYMSACVCSPSRAGLFTGMYQQRFGYDNNLPPGTQDGLPLDVSFGTKRLQALGYKTGLVGKWHLGYPATHHPNKRGFDWFYGLLQGSRPYYPMPSPTKHRVIQENGESTPEQGYVTDRFGDAACRFIKESGTKPFFLFVSFTAPHGPLQPNEGADSKTSHISDNKRKRYAGLVVSLDENVGRILDCLKKQGVEDSTLVIFTNDNGGQTRLGANNFPLKGRKGTLWEGGIRVPWAMRWPGKIQPGSVIDDPIVALDLMPTFIELAGGKVEPSWRLDGISLAARITGKQVRLPGRDLFWRKGGNTGVRAMRSGKWKLVAPHGESPSLYDLSKDIDESLDLAGRSTEQVKTMMAGLDAWSSELTDPRWGPGARVTGAEKKTRRKGKSTRSP